MSPRPAAPQCLSSGDGEEGPMVGLDWLSLASTKGCGWSRRWQAQPKWHPVAGHNSIPRSGHPVGSGDVGSARQGCHESTQQMWHLLGQHLPFLPTQHPLS